MGHYSVSGLLPPRSVPFFMSDITAGDGHRQLCECMDGELCCRPQLIKVFLGEPRGLRESPRMVPNWKSNTFNYQIRKSGATVMMLKERKTAKKFLKKSRTSRGANGTHEWAPVYTKNKEGPTHNWTILSSISFFSRRPSRTAETSIALSSRGSAVSPYSLGSIFSRRTGGTSRSRITLEERHALL